MALGIYLNATAGATNGTLEVAGDQVGIQLNAVGSVATFGLRCSVTNEATTETVTVPAPTDCQVSKDGITYGTSVAFTSGEIIDTNKLVYVKRTGATVTASTWTGIALSPRLALVATAVNHAPAAFTPTVGSITANGCTVTFSTTDVDGDSLTYKVAVTASATPPADWSGYSNSTSPKAVTGLTEVTNYYAHVRAYDGKLATVGTSAQFQTASASDQTAPTGPTSVSAAAGDAQATITYSGAADAVGVTNYDEYHTTHGGSAPSSGTTPSHADVGSSPCVISGLTNGTAYDFWIRAKDAAGNKGDWVAASQNASAGVTPNGWVSQWSDNFNRTNGALGANWTLQKITGSDPAISTNVVALTSSGTTSTGDDLATNATYATNHRAQFKITAQTGDWAAQVGPMICMAGSTNAINGYVAWIYAANGDVQLVKYVNGTPTQLGSTYSSGAAVNHTFAIEKEGSTIRVLYDGAVVITATDSTHTSGVAGFRFNVTASHSISINDFATFTHA